MLRLCLYQLTMRTPWIPTSPLASRTVPQNQLNLPTTSNHLCLSYVTTCLLNTWQHSLHRDRGGTSDHLRPAGMTHRVANLQLENNIQPLHKQDIVQHIGHTISFFPLFSNHKCFRPLAHSIFTMSMAYTKINFSLQRS